MTFVEKLNHLGISSQQFLINLSWEIIFYIKLSSRGWFSKRRKSFGFIEELVFESFTLPLEYKTYIDI